MGILMKLWEWLHCWIPKFNRMTPKPTRIRLVGISAWVAFMISLLVVCLLIPISNCVSLTKQAPRIRRYWHHYVLGAERPTHKRAWYHNRSFQTAILWGIIGGCCTLVYCNNDLVVVTKRLGRIPVAFMPALLFLTLRPSPLPHTLYLSLLPVHKWLARIIVFQCLMHSALYLWWFSVSATMYKMKKFANISGVIALFLLILIGATSVHMARRAYFRMFYYIHYLSTWIFVGMVCIHSRPPSTIYIALSILILLYQAFYRVYNTRTTVVTVTSISPSLALMEFPMKDIALKPKMPASHVRLNLRPQGMLKRIFFHLVPLQHPYTIASLPTDETVRLIIRRSRLRLKNNGTYYITGAFESKIDFISKDNKSSFSTLQSRFQVQTPILSLSPLHYCINARKVLITVGGSAISFGLPLLRILNFNGVNVRLIWVTRDCKDLNILNKFRNNFNGLEVYITNLEGDEQDLEIDYVDYEETGGPMENTARPYMPRPSKSDDHLIASSTTKTSSLFPSLNSKNRQLESTSKSALFAAANFTQLEDTAIPDDDDDDDDDDDEVDFTELFSARRINSHSPSNKFALESPLGKGSVFRKPKYIVASDYGSISSNGDFPEEADFIDRRLTLPAGAKLFFGRPTLSSHDYDWCVQSDCIGPSDTNECVERDQANRSATDILAGVWVIAAGPPGLVNTTRRWATDSCLNFHEESFSV